MKMRRFCFFALFSLCVLSAGCIKQRELPSMDRVYSYRDSEQLAAPSFTLQEDGTFTFHFSALSSYIGHGSYQLDENVLILTTDDGDFSYQFDIVEEGFAFDAEHSSEQIWYADFSDGAVFR